MLDIMQDFHNFLFRAVIDFFGKSHQTWKSLRGSWSKVPSNPISQLYGFNEMKAAHLQQETGRTVGKIVVTLD
ncbi:hypothetical protein SAMN05421740_104245 [Parapedobacter koreensis]|uniref:Zinc-binding dehydrogenase n=2 Tax=Parapedobacter koreensis TaxID=332977 RepID=A0A1H7P803_9SPHI|nr:hypothetical protein SAMN05421740_104245 [Parapedobacter koreensis]